METLPCAGFNRPAMALRMVDFPHPVGPTMERNSPSPTLRFTFCTATNEPNAMVTSSIATIGWGLSSVTGSSFLAGEDMAASQFAAFEAAASTNLLV
ncbi:hypothetical protein D3C78_851580 [compost metagenome]